MEVTNVGFPSLKRTQNCPFLLILRHNILYKRKYPQKQERYRQTEKLRSVSYILSKFGKLLVTKDWDPLRTHCKGHCPFVHRNESIHQHVRKCARFENVRPELGFLPAKTQGPEQSIFCDQNRYWASPVYWEPHRPISVCVCIYMTTPPKPLDRFA